MKRRLNVALLLFLTGLLFHACGSDIDRKTADKLAKEAVEKYCQQEDLTFAKFSIPGVVDQGKWWLYNYTYEGKPRHLLSVIVHKDGETEVSRMIEEKDVP